MINSFDTSKIKRVAKKNMRKKIRLFNSNLRMLMSRDCFEAVIINNTNFIYLISYASLNAINEIVATTSEIRNNLMSYEELERKREIVDEISKRHHVRKKQIV